MERVKQTTERVELPETPVIIPPDLGTPPEGMLWKRTYDGMLFQGEIYFGIVLKDGKLSKIKVKETSADFELVERPDDY